MATEFRRKVLRDGAFIVGAAIGCTSAVVGSGVHASCGPTAYLLAFGGGSSGGADYVPGRAVPSVIEMKRESTD